MHESLYGATVGIFQILIVIMLVILIVLTMVVGRLEMDTALRLRSGTSREIVLQLFGVFAGEL